VIPAGSATVRAAARRPLTRKRLVNIGAKRLPKGAIPAPCGTAATAAGASSCYGFAKDWQ